jgi:ferric-dicitrate binding protein FerR (iron transport regulator)
LDFYFKEKADACLEEKIQDWLGGEPFADEKDELLREVWDDRVKVQEPDEYAHASLESMRKRLGFPSPGVAVEEVGMVTSRAGDATKETKGLRPVRKIRWSMAAAVAILIGVGGVLFFAKENEVIPVEPEILVTAAEPLFQTVTTGDERLQKHVVLPDGSEVWLNRNSRITYPADFSEGRTVELDGDARFTVVKQEDGRPFTVQGADLRITVLGTEFTFRSREEETTEEIRLIEGSVEVDRSGDLYRMNPNDLLTFDRQTNGVSIRRLVEEAIRREIVAPEPEPLPEPEPGLNFDNVPLEEVLRILCEQFGGTFIVDERIPLDSAITVKFGKDETLDEILFVISNTYGIFDYTIKDNQINLTRH